jgi:phage replication O-like protein O
MSKLIPNFTQVPNCFFDEIMSELGHAEIKCLLYIIRRTYGFHRDSDKIALSQFENGINGLDKGTGLAKKNIYKALDSLVERKIINKQEISGINSYSLNIEELSELGTQGTQNGYARYPELGTQGTIQKKEEIKIETKESKLSHSRDYLIKIPDTDIAIFTEKYNCKKTDIITKGDQLYNWIESKNKKYVNYRSVLLGALSRDYGLRVSNSAMKI